MKIFKKTAFIVFIILSTTVVKAQDFWKNHQLNLNEDGSNYLKLSGYVQPWLRYADYNPGTTVFGYPKQSGTDIGIRRFGLIFSAQVTNKVFFYSQLGQNNINSISDRKQGFFVHDALAEYAVDKKKLSVGFGLSAWSGLSRFSSASGLSLMGLDAPFVLQTTIDATDQFVRKLSVYAKGKLGKLDYRLALAEPMAIQKSAGYNSPPISKTAAFSPEPPKLQWNSYFQYQFKDQESNLTPYTAGTYFGKKDIFNIGTGFVYQKDAMWYLQNNNETVYHNLVNLAVDVFYDKPIGNKGEAISAYGVYTYLDYGHNYIRNLGSLNPGNGSNDASILNGGGNSFPLYGTGNVLYAQVGYKLKDNLIGKTTLMPYMSMQKSYYKALNNPMVFYDLGVNWILSGHNSKFTLAYENRPIYKIDGNLNTRKSSFILQYQVMFN